MWLRNLNPCNSWLLTNSLPSVYAALPGTTGMSKRQEQLALRTMDVTFKKHSTNWTIQKPDAS
jgi:hypothetical protein